MKAGDVVSGRFTLLAPAGAGGMGVVFRARDEASGTPVALKILTGHGSDAAERFAREALVLSELRHPGVVRYVAHGTTGEGEGYLAMEWLDGESLAARLARGVLSVPEALLLGHRVADALALAHSRGIVHRDLKPANLFLRGGIVGHVVVLDFGIARLLAPGQTLTVTGGMLGTPGYMAPEQARSGAIDPRTDVYALGCVLFRVLAGRAPHESDTPMAVLLKAVSEDAPPLSSFRPDVPPALVALVARMLARDPDARPRDAFEVAHALSAIAQTVGLSLVSRDSGAPLPPTWSMQPVRAASAPSFGGPAPTVTAQSAGGTFAPLARTDATPPRSPSRVLLLGGGLALLGIGAVAAALVLASGASSASSGATSPAARPPGCFTDGCAPLGVSNPKHVDPFDLLSGAEKLARSIDSSAKLAAINAEIEDGVADLTTTSHGITFNFGTGGNSRETFKGMIVVVATPTGLTAVRTAQSPGFDPIPEPKCTVRDAMAAASAAGQPRGGIHVLSYFFDIASARPVVAISVGNDARVLRADDCEKVR